MDSIRCSKYEDGTACGGIKDSEICSGCSCFSTKHPYVTYPVFQTPNNMSVKSDGGSSSYYEINLPQKVIDRIVSTGKVEVKDIVRYGFGNDFDCGNIIKATKRIYENKQGRGKQGTDVSYDANKIKFFTEELINA